MDCSRSLLCQKFAVGCTVCKKFQGKPYKTPPPPPLPSCRVKEAPAFTYIGLDYVGPLYVKSTSEKISDNAKTFKSASKELEKIMNDPSVIRHFTQERIKWSYNLGKASWWGGFYERLVKSLKSGLKKTIGQAKLAQDELVTVSLQKPK